MFHPKQAEKKMDINELLDFCHFVRINKNREESSTMKFIRFLEEFVVEITIINTLIAVLFAIYLGVAY